MVLDELREGWTERYGVVVEVRAVTSPTRPSAKCFCVELATRNISILCANAEEPRRSDRSRNWIAWRNGPGSLKLRCGATTSAWRLLARDDGRKSGRDSISGYAAGKLPIPTNATYAATKA